MMNIYQEEVMDHYEHPRNQGELVGGDVWTGREANASCGDMLQFQLKVKRNRFAEVKWKGVGCAITTAAASKLSEWLKGRTVEEVKKLGKEGILREGVGFKVNPGRKKCLTLPIKVVEKLLRQHIEF